MKFHIMIQLSRSLWHLPTSLLGHKYRDKCHSYAKYMPDIIHACMMFALYTLTPFSNSGSSSFLFLCEEFPYSSWGTQGLSVSFKEGKDMSSHSSSDPFHITVCLPVYFSTHITSFLRARTVVSIDIFLQERLVYNGYSICVEQKIFYT